jgi:hypothetical protein
MTIFVSLLLCAVFCQAATKHKGEGNSEIDFRTMHSEQVVSLFQNAGELKVNGKGDAAAACNGKNKGVGANEMACMDFARYNWEGGIVLEDLSPAQWIYFYNNAKLKNDLQTKKNAQLFPLMAALVRGCAIYAPSPVTSRYNRTCLLLANVFDALGNKEAAATVLEFAPGCSTYIKGVLEDVCFGPAWSNISDKATVKRIARKTCDTVHDQTACEYLANLGEKVDMNAVQRAKAQAVEDRQEYEDAKAEKLAKADAEANRPNTLLAVLQGMPGANDPNAIVNAGNQQAAAMRAIGNANAAAQQQAMQARVSTQEQAAQQVQSAAPQKSQQNVATPSSSAGSAEDSGSVASAPNGASSSTSSTRYASPLPYSCIRQYWDPQFYNWLSFENDCGVAVNLTFIFGTPTGWAMNGSMTLAPGAHKNSGLSSADINKAGGFKYYVCPDGYIPVDANNSLVTTSSITEFRCKAL